MRLEMDGDALAEELFSGLVGVVSVVWIGDVGCGAMVEDRIGS